MPNQYSRGYGGAGRSYGGSRVAAYQGPTSIQAQSFFNPVPIETMMGELNRRQDAFDTAYAGTLSAKDELAQTQVGMADLADKNRIIKEGMGDIDSLVQDKYGGDWGRAAKAVAGQVTSIRGHKFWNAQKEAEKRREEAREFKLKNPDAFIFNDPTNLSVLDEEGQVRGAEAFTPDMVERGDYATTARQIMSVVKADAQAFGLSQVDADKFSHFLQTGSREGISEEKIREIAANPEIQKLFLGQHTEIGRAIGEMDQEQLQRHGLAGMSAEQFAEQQLTGAGLPMVHSQTDLKFIQDQMAMKRETAAAKKAAEVKSVYGPTRDIAATPTGFGAEARDLRKSKFFFGKDGSFVDTMDPLRMMTSTEDRLLRQSKGNNIAYQRLYEENKAEIEKERANHPQTHVLNNMRNMVSDLRKNNPNLTAGKSDEQVFKDFHSNMDRFSHTIDMAMPILNEDINNKVGASVAANMSSTNWYVDPGKKVTTNWDGKNGIAEMVNIPAQTMQQLVQNGEIPINYNVDKGQHFLEVPIVDGDIHTGTDGKINWSKTESDGSKRIYFSPDTESKGYAHVIQTANQLMKDAPSKQTLIGNLPPEIEFMESEFNQQGDVDNQKVFRMLGADDQYHNYSLNQLRMHYTSLSEQHLANTYGSFD